MRWSPDTILCKSNVRVFEDFWRAVTLEMAHFAKVPINATFKEGVMKLADILIVALSVTQHFH
jgi:hypothetical protein